MFKKRYGNKINASKINEVASLASNVLKVMYFLLSALCIYLVLLLFKETNILHFIWVILKVVAPLFIGIVIAWLFNPFVNWLQTKKINRTLGTFITYLIIILVIVIILGTFIPLLTNQIKEFIKIAPDVFNSLKIWLINILDHFDNSSFVDIEDIKEGIFEKINTVVTDITNELPTAIINGISSFFSGMGTVLLSFIIGFFLLLNSDNSKQIQKVIPKKIQKDTEELFGNVNDSLRKYVKGAVIDCTAVFILSSIGLWAIGLKAPFLFGFICGLTNIIPYLGPYLGGFPAALVGFTQSPTVGILTIVVVVVIQTLESNFLQPYIMSKTTKIHPITIMLGLLIFGHFFGIIGMLISTPVLASIKTIFHFFNDKYDFFNEKEIEEQPSVSVELNKIKENIKKEK